MSDNKNSKIFVSIIEDLSNIIEQLREDNKCYNKLLQDNDYLHEELEQMKQTGWCKDLTIYFLLTLGISHYIF